MDFPPFGLEIQVKPEYITVPTSADGPPSSATAPWSVPTGHFFVFGDNKADRTYFGKQDLEEEGNREQYYEIRMEWKK